MKNIIIDDNLERLIPQLCSLCKDKKVHVIIATAAYRVAKLIICTLTNCYDPSHISLRQDVDNTVLVTDNGSVFEAMSVDYKAKHLRGLSNDYTVIYDPFSIPSETLKAIILL